MGFLTSKTTSLARKLCVLLGLLSRLLPLHAEQHWAYSPPERSTIDAANKHPIDALLEKKWRDSGISPNQLAAPQQWVARAAYTLTGLPPTLEQISRIEKNPSDEEWKKLIDELLASPAYGERWARHWMDVARYADTQGYNFDRDNRYPFAYTYRDWLIKAFQNDMPYDQFILRQLAADHLEKQPTHPDLAALGFLTVGPRLLREADTIDDKVDVITRGLLSSTVACARCHDHKSDPILMEDYYSIYSIIQHTKAPSPLPEIGEPMNRNAHQEYLAEMTKFDQKDRQAAQSIIDQLHAPESLAGYLEAGWLAKKENWNMDKAITESFKRKNLRPKAVMQWRIFFQSKSAKGKINSTLQPWFDEMEASADDSKKRQKASQKLANEWTAASNDSPLFLLARDAECPLSVGIEKIDQFMHRQDTNEKETRLGERAKIQATHPGSPPRAMSLVDHPKIGKPRVFKRGNPDQAGPVFERTWLGFLGGGEYPMNQAPRLTLAKKITAPENPLTARVMVNRVWGWHFGSPLADPSDFGPQEPTPPLLPLLDELALHLQENSWSLKELHRFILTSKAYRLSSDSRSENNLIDEMNATFWRWNRQRADFESMRDRLLSTAGSLQPLSKGGPSTPLHEVAADHRRSIYGFIDRYALPSYLVSFDLPHPDHHAPKRSETTVPQQALWFLNGELITRQAAQLAKNIELQALRNPSERVEWLYQRIHQRLPTAIEKQSIIEWVASARPEDYLPKLNGTWRALYAQDHGNDTSQAQPFPIFHGGQWKTGNNLAKAPVPFLHAAATGGHVGHKHLLVLRWHAGGAGEVRLRGNLQRTQKGGNDLAWFMSAPSASNTQSDYEGKLKEGGTAAIVSPWISVKPSDTIDFVLHAPEGDSFGGIDWSLSIEGSEHKGGKTRLISDWKKHFPKNNDPIPAPTTGAPWADVIQLLWSSNEFHFIE